MWFRPIFVILAHWIVAPVGFSFPTGLQLFSDSHRVWMSPIVICICRLPSSKHSSIYVLSHPFQWHSAPACLVKKIDALYNTLYDIQLCWSSHLKKKSNQKKSNQLLINCPVHRTHADSIGSPVIILFIQKKTCHNWYQKFISKWYCQLKKMEIILPVH